MHLQNISFVVLSAFLINAISCNCELELGEKVCEQRHHHHHRRDITKDRAILYDAERPCNCYPHHRYGHDSITLTETGRSDSISEELSSSRRGHIHGRPSIHAIHIKEGRGHHYHHGHQDPISLTHVHHGHRHPYDILTEHKVIEKDGTTIDKKLLELQVNRPSVRFIDGEVYEKIGAPHRGIGHCGYRSESPRLEEVDIVKTNLPGKKIIDVEVIKREPSYGCLPSHHYHHHLEHPHHTHKDIRSGEVIVKENVKLPSVALKERETIYLGGEHQKSHRISSEQADAILKKIRLGCGCRYY